ncbi:MAG: J domain-containing protein [Polyangiales bacterium]
MEPPRRLSERSLDALLCDAARARAEGMVVLREHSGIRHGVWMRAGHVVGAHVAGRHDPLLTLLVQRGVLDAAARRRCLEALRHMPLRAGQLATARFGVPALAVRDTLQRQLVARLEALLQIAASDGYDAALEPGPVPDTEASVCMPLGALLRRMPGAAPARPASGPVTRDEARRELRRLAKALHPDRHGDLDPAVQHALARKLAEATAAYHGFR